MNRILTLKEIVAGYALAGISLCLGFYFSFRVGDEHGSIVLKIFYLLAALIVINFTFAWGRLRGFAAREQDGRIVWGHVVRNLVMSAVAGGGVIFIFAPVMMWIFRLTQ